MPDMPLPELDAIAENGQLFGYMLDGSGGPMTALLVFELVIFRLLKWL